MQAKFWKGCRIYMTVILSTLLKGRTVLANGIHTRGSCRTQKSSLICLHYDLKCTYLKVTIFAGTNV